MPPYHTRDDLSCQQHHPIRPSPYCIPDDRVATRSTQAADLNDGPITTSRAVQLNIPQSSLIAESGPFPRALKAEDMTARPIDQWVASILSLETDILDHRGSRENGQPGDATSVYSGLEGEEYMVVLVRGVDGNSVPKLEVTFVPEREPLQSQMDTLLAEGYRLAAGSHSSDLQVKSIEVRRLDLSGNVGPRRCIRSVSGESPARSPTSPLTSVAAAAEETDSDTDSTDLISANQMIIDLLEEANPSDTDTSSSSLIGRSTTTSHEEAAAQPLASHAEEGLDDLLLIHSPTTGPRHAHSTSPTPPRLRSTPPLTEASPGLPLFKSASSSTSIHDYPATPDHKPSTSGHISSDSKPLRDSSSSPPARPQSPRPSSPFIPMGSNMQTEPVVPPSLGLALRPRHVVKRSQAEPSNSREPPARFDDLTLWIDHFNTLSTLANGLQLRDPLPGDKVSQNQAFLSFRSLFIELFSFSARPRGSMIGIPGAVSRHECKRIENSD